MNTAQFKVAKLLYFDIFIKECADNEFRCVDGTCKWGDNYDYCIDTPCVPVGWRCDGTVDCSDGSDENDCGGIIENLLILKITTRTLEPCFVEYSKNYCKTVYRMC